MRDALASLDRRREKSDLASIRKNQCKDRTLDRPNQRLCCRGSALLRSQRHAVSRPPQPQLRTRFSNLFPSSAQASENDAAKPPEPVSLPEIFSKTSWQSPTFRLSCNTVW